jgi:hypothetical protein
VAPELLVMPTPLRVRVNVGVAAMMKALAPALNTMPFTWVLAEIEMSEMEDESKVAVAAEPLGTVIDDQLEALFQLPLAGELSQVPLPAKAEPVAKNIGIITAQTMERACRCKRKAAAGWSGEVAGIRISMSFLQIPKVMV